MRIIQRILRACLLTLALANVADGQAPPSTLVTPIPEKSASADSPLPSTEQLSTGATRLIRQLLPREFGSQKKWGQTKEVVSGLKVRLDGLRIRTNRRRKTVNHGLWKRYSATVINPEEELLVRIGGLSEAESGRAVMDIVVVAKLDLTAQLAKWQTGIRIFSLTARADAKVRFQLRVELAAHLDPTRLPPDVLLDVEAKEVELELLEFNLRRLSDIRGGAARQLGKLVRDFAEEELEDHRKKLVQKVNRKIEKSKDKLRLSLRDLVPDNLNKKNPESTELESAPASAASPSRRD